MGKKNITLQESLLGKVATYPNRYDPTLLFPIERSELRQAMGLDPCALPFYGVDIWTAFELSWLNAQGKPQVALATITIPADSPYLIESKSFKLYLNSFNQTNFVDVDALKACLMSDLSLVTGASVSVDVTLPKHFSKWYLCEMDGESLDEIELEVKDYAFCPAILQIQSTKKVTETLRSDIFKSNCPVTGQPDWASIQIHYMGQEINRQALLRYLIGFRLHQSFHEQCIEQIFMDIQTYCQPDSLCVYARYTRRGGLDINPLRSSSPHYQGRSFLGRTARQ